LKQNNTLFIFVFTVFFSGQQTLQTIKYAFLCLSGGLLYPVISTAPGSLVLWSQEDEDIPKGDIGEVIRLDDGKLSIQWPKGLK